jgi:hypothetical protein
MRSGSANVMDVTLDGFTPASHFPSLFKHLNLSINEGAMLSTAQSS